MDAILANVQIKIGVKIENAQFLKRLDIVMNAMKNVERDYWRKSSHMHLLNLPEGMAKIIFWTALKETKKTESFIIARA